MAEDQSASFDGQDDANAPFTKIQEHGDKELSDVIAAMLDSLNPLPASSPKDDCCIYKVPDHIRKSNQEAYTPQVISIGPFHRNNPNLQKMEDFKLRYLKNFTERDPKMNLEYLVSTIRGEEKSVRECYSETITLGSDDFVTMILVDACFIIEYFLKNKLKIWTEYDLEILEPGLCNRMQMDLILLENQLPFFIIEKIYDTALKSRSEGGRHPFIELCFCQFEYYNVQEFVHHDPDRDSGSSGMFILHFTDLLRNFCMPPRERRPKGSFELSVKEMPSATQLDEVRLKFKMSKPSNNRSPLELKYACGVLEIPRSQLDNTMEIYARNLVALEKCHNPYKDEAYITDYYILLSFLIKTGKDLDVLVREQIIDNWLDGVVATSMISKLSGEKRFYIQMNSDYYKIAKKLNEFYNNPPKLITLIRVLFRTRLAGTVTISSSVGLFFTAVGSACSVLALKYK